MSDTPSTSTSPINPDNKESLREASQRLFAQLDAAVIDTLLTPIKPILPPTHPNMSELTPSKTPKVPPPPPPTKTHTVGGFQFIITPSKPIINKPTQIGILYKKEHRPPIGSKEEAELIKIITCKQGDPYKEITTSFKDPDSLKNNLSLGQRLNHTESAWKSADLLNPCNILFPIPNTVDLEEDANGTTKQLYLFTHFRQLDRDQVAASCEYYAKYIQFPVSGSTIPSTFARELEWSYSYFRNNVEPRIYELVQVDFLTYSTQEQGGPLFLKLLLDHLVLSNDTNEAALIDTVFNYNIKNLNKTEDIYEVTRLLSSITDTIIAIRDHKENPLPDDYLQHLTTIFQTTSVDAFNRTFSKLEDDVTYSRRFRMVSKTAALRNSPHILSSAVANQITMDNTPDYCTIVFTLANETYRELRQLGTWDSSLRPDVDHASTMIANKPDHPKTKTIQYCWNCGEPNCNIMTCPKPKDKERIDANRKLFYRNKKDPKEATTHQPSNTPEHKPIPYAWRPPEPHENNKRVIHGKPYTYNPAKPGWDEDDTPPSGLAAHTKQDDATVLTMDTSSISASDFAQVQLDLANILRTFHPS